MTIPNSYTYDTFADYLKDQVLLDSVSELGWIDTVSQINPFVMATALEAGSPIIPMGHGRMRCLTEGSGTTKAILPAPFDIPAGTKLNIEDVDSAHPYLKVWVTFDPATVSNTLFFTDPAFVDNIDDNDVVTFQADAGSVLPTPLVAGTKYFVVGAAALSNNLAQFEISDTMGGSPIEYDFSVDSIRMIFDAIQSPNLGTLDADVKAGDTVIEFTSSVSTTMGDFLTWYNAPAPRSRNPIYAAITDEVLFKLGFTDISGITGVANLRKMRLYGRREVWRFAMEKTAGDYNYEGGSATSSTRQDAYEHFRAAFQMEDDRINSLYDESLLVVTPVEEALYSVSDKIIPRW